MHESVMTFVARALYPKTVKGKRVLEVGSRDINGSPRALIETHGPAEYIGVDLVEGPGVDLVMNSGDLFDYFGSNCFEIVLSTETLEHIQDWKSAIHNIKRVCTRGGIIVLTTRSPGFHLHEYPGDFWRFSLADIANIFSDCHLELLEPDPQAPGVFVKVTKPTTGFMEWHLAGVKVMSVGS